MKIAIDTNLLIKEIERRPTIWDKKRSDHNDKLAKQKCWDELTELFSPTRISQKNKQELNFLLQNRWKNVKDQFSRSIKAGGRRKSQYVHTPVLKFLPNPKRNKKFVRSANNVVPKVRRTLSTSAKSRKVPERKSKLPPAKRTRTSNSLAAPRSKITSSETPEEPSISLEISDVSEDESTSSGIPDMPEELSNPPPEISTRTDNSLITSKNTPSVLLELLDVSEELNPPPEKRTKTGNSLVTSRNTPSASSELLNMSEEELNPNPEIRARIGNSSVTSKNTPSFSSEMIYVPEEESKPPPEKRTKIHNNLVEAKLIEFLERSMMELQGVTKNSQDEDRLFLLSLLTSLKTIQPQFQLKAKIEILSVLDKYPKIYEEVDILSQPQILEVRHSVNM